MSQELIDKKHSLSRHQFSSVAQSCLTLCNPMDYSTPGFPVHHQLPELTQTHVHRVMMPSNHHILCCPLLLQPSILPSITIFSNELFFSSGGQTFGVSASASVLPKNIQDRFPLGWTGLISLQSRGLSRIFSNTTIQSINSSVLRFLDSQILTTIHDSWKNHSFG